MSAAADNWKRAELWRMRGRDFMVEVYHYTEQVVELTSWYGDGTGPHRWNVYAYIYPKHPHFAAFKRDEGMWQEAGSVLPFHGGVSLLEFPQYDDKVASVKVGCDYNHLHDDAFTRMEKREHAGKIFEDAEALFERLKRMSDDARTEGGRSMTAKRHFEPGMWARSGSAVRITECGDYQADTELANEISAHEQMTAPERTREDDEYRRRALLWILAVDAGAIGALVALVWWAAHKVAA